MGAGDAPRSDVERRQAGPPIGSGRGPMRIGGAAKARAVDMLAETPSLRSWRAARAFWACPRGICALPASACGHPIRPVLKHGPRSLTCVRVNGRVNPYGARKLTGGIPSRAAPPTDLDLLRRVRVRAYLSGPERW